MSWLIFLYHRVQVRDLFRFVTEKFGLVHTCVNVPSIEAPSGVLDGSPQQWRDMFEVNVVGVCLLSKLVVHCLMENAVNEGHIVNISRWILHSEGYLLAIFTSYYVCLIDFFKNYIWRDWTIQLVHLNLSIIYIKLPIIIFNLLKYNVLIYCSDEPQCPDDVSSLSDSAKPTLKLLTESLRHELKALKSNIRVSVC